jgi:hypothetical protein
MRGTKQGGKTGSFATAFPVKEKPIRMAVYPPILGIIKDKFRVWNAV